MNDPNPPDPIPSATVVTLRQTASEIEILLLQRTSRSNPGGGAWVFPGGKVDDTDGRGRPYERAVRAAVRETHEEARLELDENRLVPISRWVTPEVAPKRFDTWFFMVEADTETSVVVDGDEICDHQWTPAARLLALQARDELRLAPPTFVTLTWLAPFEEVGEAIHQLARDPIPVFRPLVCPATEGACMLYPGDAGYETAEVDRPGPRHRLWADSGARYRYECDVL